MRILGMSLSSTMTVLRLRHRRLLVHSPVPLTEELVAEVRELGIVSDVYVPNTFHYRNAHIWAERFRARVHAPSQIIEKSPGLQVDRLLGDEMRSELRRACYEVPIRGFRLHETALFHKSSQTLIVADAVHNVGRPRQAWAQLYSRCMGFYDRVAVSRAIRWSAFSDRRTARHSVDKLLALNFRRLVVGHGAIIDNDAVAAFEQAYDWLC